MLLWGNNRRAVFSGLKIQSRAAGQTIPETRFVPAALGVQVANRKRCPPPGASAQTTNWRASICADVDSPKDRREFFRNRVPFVDSSYCAFLLTNPSGQGETSAVQAKNLQNSICDHPPRSISNNKKAFVLQRRL